MQTDLPDFNEKIITDSCIAFKPYNGEIVRMLPRELVVAKNENNTPAFLLEYRRRRSSFGLPKPHGILYIRFATKHISEEILTGFQEQWPKYIFNIVSFDRGFIRLLPMSDFFKDTKEDLQQPIALNGLAINKIYFEKKVSENTAIAMKAALLDNTLLVDGLVELEINGVAPRLPFIFEFDPVDLTKEIISAIDEGTILSRQAIVDFFFEKDDLEHLVVPKDNEQAKEYDLENILDRRLIVETITDLIIKRFGQYVPAPVDDLQPYVTINAFESAESGTFTWDLSEARKITKIYQLNFNPFIEARTTLAKEGMNSVYKETLINRWPTGHVTYNISHYFDSLPDAIKQITVNLKAESNPPFRPRAISESVDLSLNERRVTQVVKFSPREEFRINYNVSVIYEDKGETKKIESDYQQTTDTHIRIRYSDIPLKLFSVSSSDDLLKEAVINGKMLGDSDTIQPIEFELNESFKEIAFALPQEEIEGSSLQVTAKLKTKNKEVSTVYSLEKNINIQPFSFKEFGVHTVDIECVFKDHTNQLAIEFCSEKESTNETNIVLFTPDNNQKKWSWFADSIFYSGFKYRQHFAENKKGEWSEIFPFDQSELSILVSQFSMDETNVDNNSESSLSEQEIPLLVGDKDYKQIRYFRPTEDSKQFHFIPLLVGFQKDAQGDPLISLLIMGSNAILQLTAQWKAEEALLDEVTEHIAKENDIDPLDIRLSFHSIEVEKVELIIIDNQEEILETSTSSGYYPFNAVFNTNLDLEQQDIVIGAFHEQAQKILIRYYGVRSGINKITAKIEGNIESCLEDLSNDASLLDCKNWLQKAIEENVLHLKLTSGSGSGSENTKQVEEEVLNTARSYIKDFLQIPNPTLEEASISVEAKQEEIIEIPFTLDSDIATWFEGRNGDDYLKII